MFAEGRRDGGTIAVGWVRRRRKTKNKEKSMTTGNQTRENGRRMTRWIVEMQEENETRGQEQSDVGNNSKERGSEAEGDGGRG